jgi:hypothetical protein
MTETQVETRPTYAELEKEVERLTALLEERFNDIRLVQWVDGQMDIQGGPIGYCAAYMAEMLETPTDNRGDDYCNYIEMRVNNDKAGPLVLRLQRCYGETPHELRRQAEAERDAAVRALCAAINSPKGVVPTGAERWHSADTVAERS